MQTARLYRVPRRSVITMKGLRKSISMEVIKAIPQKKMRLIQKRDFDFYCDEKSKRSSMYKSQTSIVVYPLRLKKVNLEQKRKGLQNRSSEQENLRMNIMETELIKNVLMNKSCDCEECGKHSLKQLKFDGLYLTTKTKMSIRWKRLRQIFQKAVKNLIIQSRFKIMVDFRANMKFKRRIKIKMISGFPNPFNFPGQRGTLIPQSRGTMITSSRGTLIPQSRDSSTMVLELSKKKSVRVDSEQSSARKQQLTTLSTKQEEFIYAPRLSQQDKNSRIYRSFKRSNNVIDNYLSLNNTKNRGSMTDLVSSIQQTRATTQQNIQISNLRSSYDTNSLILKGRIPSPIKQSKIYQNNSILQLLRKQN